MKIPSIRPTVQKPIQKTQRKRPGKLDFSPEQIRKMVKENTGGNVKKPQKNEMAKLRMAKNLRTALTDNSFPFSSKEKQVLQQILNKR